jgi:hypothetical protein
VGRLYLVDDAAEIARRRRLLPRDQLVEAWPDLYRAGAFWLGERSKERLDEAGAPLAPRLVVGAAAIPIYYGPRLDDTASLPLEESLQARVLSAHGIAVAWITLDRFGERSGYEPTGPADPTFYLRRPGGTAAHIWRLFRNRREARVYMAEFYGGDREGCEWAERIAVESFEELLGRYTVGD